MCGVHEGMAGVDVNHRSVERDAVRKRGRLSVTRYQKTSCVQIQRKLSVTKADVRKIWLKNDRATNDALYERSILNCETYKYLRTESQLSRQNMYLAYLIQK